METEANHPPRRTRSLHPSPTPSDPEEQLASELQEASLGGPASRTRSQTDRKWEYVQHRKPRPDEPRPQSR